MSPLDGTAQPFSREAQGAATRSGVGMRKGAGDDGRRFREVADATRWAELRALKLGPCVVCRYLGAKQEFSSSLHHVVSKSLGGDDIAENLVPVCGSGTTGCHGLLEAHHPETCRAFAAAVQQYDDAVYAYAIEKLGEERFLKRYHAFEVTAA